jgi:quercetin dioxygenase-like cupin family protein
MGTTESVKVFIENNDISWQPMDIGVKRKIMAYDDKLMVVKVQFEKGGIGSLHQHHHSQITHIESGTFEVEIGEDKKVLIDVFSPMREDFIK